MPRYVETDTSDDGYDPATVALRAQQRILQIRRERDMRVSQIVAESNTALAALRSRIEKQHQDLQRRRQRRHANQVSAIVELVEKRQRIELKMMELLSNMQTAVEEVEDMMMTGYDGREAELSSK